MMNTSNRTRLESLAGSERQRATGCEVVPQSTQRKLGFSPCTRSAWSILVAILLVCCGLSYGQEWTWSVERVDADGGTFSALAVDNEGNVHLGYLSPEGGGTKYAFRPVGGRWFNMIVDKNNGYVNLALDKEQRPHLCYSPVQTLKHARWDGSKWLIQEIAPHSGDRAFSCGIAIGPDDAPHITWYQYTDFAGQLYLHVKHAALRDFAWQAQTLDYGHETGKWNSVRMDSKGGTHVSYSAFRDGALRYAYRPPEGKDGKWTVTTIEDGRSGRNPQTTPGMGNSMVLDKNDRPNFSYRDETTLRYAWPEGDHWRIDVVDANANPSGNMSWIGMRTSLALDAEGRPHIVYETDGALKHAWWNGSKWRIQPMGISGPEHRYGSLAISQDNVIYIAYSDPEDGSMKMLVGKPRTTISNSNVLPTPEH